MEHAKFFFEEVLPSEKAQELLSSMQKPKSEQEIVEAYLSIANTLGVALTLEDILAYFSTPKIEGSNSKEIDDDELDQLVGGGALLACKNTYRLGESCWWNDACNIFLKSYSLQMCQSLSNTSESAIYRFNKECGAVSRAISDNTTSSRFV